MRCGGRPRQADERFLAGKGRADTLAPTVANVATFREGKVIEMVHYPNADDALAAARV